MQSLERATMEKQNASDKSSSVQEKHDINTIEDVERSDDSEEYRKFERRTIRKVDWRMLPLLGLLYSVSLIDRTNLGIARTAGMAKDLKLTIGDRYSIASCLYFVPYILLQLPSNLILRWLGVRTALTFYVTAWGAAQLGMGFVEQWGFLVLCRVLLGVFEAGFFPALVFVITTWYTRQEVQKRLAGFYLTSIFISGFSSIFGYVLTLLHGRHGYAGWQWIFIIEGVITIGLGLLTFLFIPDFPDRNRFLTPKQTAMMLQRVEDDRGDAKPDAITFAKVMHHLSDWTLWAFALMFMCSTMPAYVVGYFITIILNGMGWGITDSLLLSAPPFVFAAMSCFVFAWISDKKRLRAPFLAVQALITLTGLFITAYSKPHGARYFGLFLVNAGATGCVPGVLAYSANNVISQSKRAVSTAVIIAFGGIGGIIATTAFREADFPTYFPGMWTTIGCQLLLLSLLAATSLTFYTRNKKARANGAVLEDTPGFYYTL